MALKPEKTGVVPYKFRDPSSGKYYGFSRNVSPINSTHACAANVARYCTIGSSKRYIQQREQIKSGLFSEFYKIY